MQKRLIKTNPEYVVLLIVPSIIHALWIHPVSYLQCCVMREQRVNKFLKNLETTPKSKHQKRDMKNVHAEDLSTCRSVPVNTYTFWHVREQKLQ